MRKVQFILFFWIFSFSNPVLAQKVWKKVNPDGQHYRIIYSEEGRWFVDYFLVKPNDLQDRIGRKMFRSETQALDFAAKHFVDFKYMNQKETLALNPDAVVFPNSNRVLWTVTRDWTDEWELAYQNWFAEEFHPSYFVEYNIETDCADAAYIARWIFARENQLPAAARLAGSNQLITQDTVRPSWVNLPTHANWWEDQLFLAAVNYVANNTYTHTLRVDTYPTQINPTYLAPGSVYLTISGDSGHTRIFYGFGPNARLTLLSSTVPRRVRPLYEENFRVSVNAAQGAGGIVRFLWPYKQDGRWRLRSPSEMSGYSLEQYASDFSQPNEYFYQAVIRKIFPSESDRDYRDVAAGIESFTQAIQARIAIVESGYLFCKENNCEPGTSNYEDWSTPSRDSRIRETLLQLLRTIQSTRDQRALDLWTQTSREAVFQIGPQLKLDWLSLVHVFKNNLYGYDPIEPIPKRWGVQTLDQYIVETENPYQNSADRTWLLYIPEGFAVKLHFERFDLESGYDFLVIKDITGRTLRYTGRIPNLVTDEFSGGGVLNFHFTSDSTEVRTGFKLINLELVSARHLAVGH